MKVHLLHSPKNSWFLSPKDIVNWKSAKKEKIDFMNAWPVKKIAGKIRTNIQRDESKRYLILSRVNYSLIFLIKYIRLSYSKSTFFSYLCHKLLHSLQGFDHQGLFAHHHHFQFLSSSYNQNQFWTYFSYIFECSFSKCRFIYISNTLFCSYTVFSSSSTMNL